MYKEKDILRKCKYCGESIKTNEYTNDFVYDEKLKYFHKNCYIEHHTKKARNKISIEQCEEYLYELSEKTKKMLEFKNERTKLFNWIIDTYDVSMFPTYFFVKMDSIFKGEYKNVFKPISPIDLLYMWQKKKQDLDKIYSNNINKGNTMDSLSRINYDLAIVISKYDSYLNWKEKNKVEKSQIEQSILEYKERQSIKSKTNTRQKINNTNNNIDINDIIDEI